jgi:hypothetical protein
MEAFLALAPALFVFLFFLLERLLFFHGLGGFFLFALLGIQTFAHGGLLGDLWIRRVSA